MQQYLDVLNEEQKQAVIHEGSPLLILAGAGSGKTRVITTKIAYLISQKNIEPWSILAVTFTKKAANEMKERAISIDERSKDAQIRTFHSFGSWFLRKFYEEAGLVSSFNVYDDDDMATLIKQCEPSLSTKEIKTVAKQISLAKDYCLTPEDDLSILCSEFDINQIYEQYQKRLRATGNVDFGDLIMLPSHLIEIDDSIATYIHNRFRVIMVDEYQDSNIAQYRLLQNLSGVKKGNDSYVCVVGDDDQSIYHFRGAEVQNILSFPQKFPGTQIIKLERNYRSTGNILKAASIVVSKNEGRLGKTLIADRGDGGNPVLAYLPDQNVEATFIGDLIMKTVETGSHYNDWAVLYRTNAQSLTFEKEFLRRKIPYKVVGSLKFYEREEIKDALCYLALIANHKDEIAFRRIINKPTRGIGPKTQDTIMQKAVVLNENNEPILEDLISTTQTCLSDFSKKAKEGAENFVTLIETLSKYFSKENEDKKLSEFVERVIQNSGLDEYHRAGDQIEGTTRVQNLNELVNSAVPYECSMEGLLSFLDSINLDRTLAAENETSDDNKVTLITLHNTKGLEYNKVVITGLEEGVFPRQDKTGAELEEERRLFYVGITRARDQLYVTSVAKRCMYGRWEYMRPSQFLKDAGSAFTVIGKEVKSFASSFSRANTNPLAEKYKQGVKIYHDDYGTGCIVKSFCNDSEFVIEVQFETGNKKKFLPQYQAKSLMIIKE